MRLALDPTVDPDAEDTADEELIRRDVSNNGCVCFCLPRGSVLFLTFSQASKPYFLSEPSLPSKAYTETAGTGIANTTRQSALRKPNVVKP